MERTISSIYQVFTYIKVNFEITVFPFGFYFTQRHRAESEQILVNHFLKIKLLLKSLPVLQHFSFYTRKIEYKIDLISP